MTRLAQALGWRRARVKRGRAPARGIEMLEARALLAAPTNLEQELLEWVNRFRINPAGEYNRLIRSDLPLSSDIPGVADAISFFSVNLGRLRSELAALAPAAPLAWSGALNDAARGHNQAMIDADSQSHELPGEGDLGERATAAGYTGWSTLGENIFAYAQSPAQAHAGFVIDWGSGPYGMQPGRGHRVNLMSPAYREVGIGVTPETDPGTEVGPMVVTQDFGARFGQTEPYLLGVVFADANDNRLYTSGEGLGGVTVTAAGPSGSFTTKTWASGGYQMTLEPGQYTVTFSGGPLAAARVRNVLVGGSNQKLDLNTLSSDPASSTVRLASTVLGVVEGQSGGITILRSGDLSQAATLRLAVGPATSASADDFVALDNNGIVTFGPGESQKTISLLTIDDTARESTETLVLMLQPETGVGVGSNGRVTMMITDNDQPMIERVAVLSARVLNTGQGRRAVALQLGGDVDARSVPRVAAFLVRRAGRDGVLNTRDDPRPSVQRVAYNAATKVATIYFNTALRAGEAVLLTVRGGFLKDLAGRVLATPVTLVTGGAASRVKVRR